jgi:hypothetical protein
MILLIVTMNYNNNYLLTELRSKLVIGDKTMIFQIKSKLLVLTMVKFYVLAGSVLEAMATAVERAPVVLIVIAPKYKESYNCRTGGSFHPN